MSSVSLILGDTTISLPGDTLSTNCSLFQNDPSLLDSPYTVQSPVTISIFGLFIEALEGSHITITQENASGLFQLCNEFGFAALSSQITSFQGSPNLESRVAALENLVRDLRLELTRTQQEVQQLSQHQSEPLLVSPPPPDPVPAPVETRPAAPPVLQQPEPFQSLIVDGLPEILGMFEGKTIKLLYRGSRDGYGAKAFHDKCNRRQPTLVIVKTSENWVFGGYTPLQWESPRDSRYKPDPSGGSFLFTLLNPHGIDPKIIPLQKEKKNNAIQVGAAIGPVFGGGRDLLICDECESRSDSYSCVGVSYHNDTRIERHKLFTGSKNFTVAEIEVFEITP